MKLLLQVLDIIGSVFPLMILCFIIVLIKNDKNKDKSKLTFYIVIGIILFLILLRT